MAGRVIEIKVVFFDVLSVISLLARQSKGAFLQQGISPIPQGQRETEILVAIADSTETVFAPPISTGTGLLVREIAPGFTVGTVVLPHSSPSALGEKGPPTVPMTDFFADQIEPEPLARIKQAHKCLPGTESYPSTVQANYPLRRGKNTVRNVGTVNRWKAVLIGAVALQNWASHNSDTPTILQNSRTGPIFSSRIRAMTFSHVEQVSTANRHIRKGALTDDFLSSLNRILSSLRRFGRECIS
jgi:hypothetical protein